MKQVAVILLVFISYYSIAQEVDKKENIFQGTRLVNGQSSNLVEKGKLNLLIQHRFGDISGGAYELFGLDQATMRLGFEYGFTDNLNLGFGRSTFLKTYDAFAKYRLVQQNRDFPFTVAATLEGSLPTLRNYFPESSDKFSGTAQLHISKTVNNFGFQVSPGFINTGFIPAKNNSYSMFILGVAGSVKLSRKVSLNAEYLYNFENEFSNTKPLSFGVDIDTGGHLFQLVLSNSQQLTGSSLYSYTAGNWGKGNIYFGFNLIREFKLKYY